MKKLFFLTLFFCMMLSLGAYSVSLSFEDITNNKNLTDVFVEIRNNDFYTAAYIPEDGILEVEIPLSKTSFFLDDLETPGKDYLAYHTPSSGHSVVHALPVGSLRGVVVDTYDNLVPYAKLRFDCQTDYGGIVPNASDSFGGISYAYAGLGNCTVFATYGSSVGQTQVSVEHAQQKEFTIVLERGIVIDYGAKNALSEWLIWIIFLFLLLVFFIFTIWKKIKTKNAEKDLDEGKDQEEAQASIPVSLPQEPVQDSQVPNSPEFTQRQKDLIAPLSETEKEVMLFVQTKGGTTTQADLYKNTRIPKTSLSRTLQSLAGKKMISITPLGKRKKIDFSDWFSKK